jgi:hypothetical protein
MAKGVMAKKTLNQTNLAALGADALATLLMEISTGSADIKRRLRLELSHSLGPQELAQDVRKRLVSLQRSTSFVGWRKRKLLVKDLETQSAMILDKIAPQDAATAFDLLWQFVEMAPALCARIDDSRGEVGDVFRAALAALPNVASRANLNPTPLAAQVWTALTNNTYGEWNGLIALLAPTLGPAGLAHLKTLVQAHGDTAPPPNSTNAVAAAFIRELRGATGAAGGNDRKSRLIKRSLQEIAAASGDTTAYINQYSPADLARKDIAAEVATLLLADAKPAKALEMLQNATDSRAGQAAWDVAYIACLTALGRLDDAQTHRWVCFTTYLNPGHLRDHLKLLPDFEDVEAEDRARAHLRASPNLHAALNFCLNWPDLLTAAEVIETRSTEINGELSALLAPAAEALRNRHPRAAVILWRAMIDDTLDHARAPRYAQAAEYVAECAAVDADITDYGQHPDHAQYVQSLRRDHVRKFAFWEKLTAQ